jgi:hypothetical protein
MTRRKLLVVIPFVFSVAAADVAMAQTPPAAMDKDAPVAGANSFTEAQAKERIEAAGFTQISGLRKDDQGIWRASAKKGETQVNVSLDFRGNVVTQ